MRNQDELIARALSLPSIDGKGHLARMLEIGHAQLNQVMKGRRNLTERQAILLAEILGRPPLDIVALIGMDRAKTEHEREWWRRRAPRFVAALTLAAVAGSDAQVPSQRAQFTELGRQSIHYAKLKRGQRRRRKSRAEPAPVIKPGTRSAAAR